MEAFIGYILLSRYLIHAAIGMCVCVSLSVLLFLSNSRCTLQTRNPSAPQKCPVTLHIDAGTRCAQKASLSSAIALNPPEHLFSLSDRPRPAAEQSGQEGELSRAELITGSVWKPSSLLLLPLLLQQVAENYLPLPLPHSHTITEHILNHL